VIWFVHRSQKTAQQAMHRAVVIDKQKIKQRQSNTPQQQQQQQQQQQP